MERNQDLGTVLKLFVAKLIASQLVNAVACGYACVLGITRKCSRMGKVNPNYGRSAENQVK